MWPEAPAWPTKDEETQGLLVGQPSTLPLTHPDTRRVPSWQPEQHTLAQ